MLKLAITKFGLPARASVRILKAARTAADLGGASDIGSAHVSKAIQYRSLDRSLCSRKPMFSTADFPFAAKRTNYGKDEKT